MACACGGRQANHEEGVDETMEYLVSREASDAVSKEPLVLKRYVMSPRKTAEQSTARVEGLSQVHRLADRSELWGTAAAP